VPGSCRFSLFVHESNRFSALLFGVGSSVGKCKGVSVLSVAIRTRGPALIPQGTVESIVDVLLNSDWNHHGAELWTHIELVALLHTRDATFCAVERARGGGEGRENQ